jgi:putative peptidoglycan lipid II flippase
MTLLSRLAGFVRDMLQASLFGASSAMDAFVIAYRIPNYLRRIFAEGSFASAFVPVFSEIKEKGDRAALKDFLDHVAGALCAVVLVVTALGMLLAPWVASVMAPGSLSDPGKHALIAEMLRIVFPYLLFISMTALAGGVLNSFRHFALPALNPVLFNLTAIAAMLWLSPRLAIPPKALAYGVLVGGVVQLLLLWPALGRLGLAPRLRFNRHHPGVRRVFTLMLPTLFSSSVAQLNLIVGTAFASLLATGSQTWLYLSDRLIEFPLGLFGVALGTVILPHLSSRFAALDDEGYAATLDWALRTVLLLALPAALGLLLLAEPLTATIYQRGQFTAFDTQMAALSLAAMSLGIPGFMLSKVLLPAFYARQDTRTPMRAAVRTVMVNVGLTVAIVTPLWWYQVQGAHGGIALATGLAGLANAALLWRALRRSGLYRPLPGWGRHLARLLTACVAMAFAVAALSWWIGDFAAREFAARWGLLLLTVAAGALAYGGALLALGWRPSQLRHR